MTGSPAGLYRPASITPTLIAELAVSLLATTSPAGYRRLEKKAQKKRKSRVTCSAWGDVVQPQMDSIQTVTHLQ